MEALSARVGMWTTRYAAHLIVLRGVAMTVGYANLHVAATVTHLAMR